MHRDEYHIYNYLHVQRLCCLLVGCRNAFVLATYCANLAGCLFTRVVSPLRFSLKEEGKQTSWICYRGSLPRRVFYPKEGGETSYILYVFFFPGFVIGVLFPASFFIRKKVKLPTFFTGLFCQSRFYGQGEGRQTPYASVRSMILLTRVVYPVAL